MRSDWDPQHGQRTDVQKRYPDITEEEWRFLLGLLKGHGLGLVGETGRQMGQRLARLERKIKARLGEGENR